MTRAQQTISFGLLVSSVGPLATNTRGLTGKLIQVSLQLYLALYLELIPLPKLVQEQIIPVVS